MTPPSPPCMHTTGVLTFALVFPMEGHASLVGQLYQQVPVRIDKMLADIQRVGGLHHVAPVVITIADKPGLLAILSHGHTAYPSQSVGFHLQALPREDTIPASFPAGAYSKQMRNPSLVNMSDTMR